MKESTQRPPKIAASILMKLSYWIERQSLVDDLEDEYERILQGRGVRFAKFWYWSQILKAIPSLLVYSIYRNIVMIKNYATITLRNIRKHKVFSFINIMGLAIGLSLCLFVIKVVFAMYGSDRFHENKDRIFRVITRVISEDHAVSITPTYPWQKRCHAPKRLASGRSLGPTGSISFPSSSVRRSPIHLSDWLWLFFC